MAFARLTISLLPTGFALSNAAAQTRITEMGFRTTGGPTGEFDAYIHREVARWATLIKSAAIRAE